MKRGIILIAAALAAGAWVACSIYDPSLLLPADGGGGGVDAPGGDDSGSDSPLVTDGPTDDGCPTGFGRCGGGCTVQLAVDPKNCGACAHDCKGAACLDGICQPTVVATGQNNPSFLAVDNGVLYWTNIGDGTVVRANVDGTGRQIIATGQSAPWVIKVSAGHVYFGNDTTGGNVVGMLADGGSPIDLSDAQASPRGICVTSSYVLFDTEDTNAGSVQRVGLDGKGLTVLTTQTNGPKDLVTDGTYAYWAATPDGHINRIKIAGGAPEVVADASAPFGLTIAGNFLYFTNHLAGGQGGSVGRVSTAGLSEVILSSAEALPRAVATDATYLYWTNEGDGTVKRVPLAGGPITVLAAGQSTPWGIAVDDAFVYWSARAGGLVLRVAK